MALAQNYDQQDCPVARALELVGERWTMLIIRDCFLGVSRFNDFLDHLDIPKATLSSRLAKLVDAGVLRREEYRTGQSNYVLTKQGEALWPILYGLAAWGETHHAPRRGPRRFLGMPFAGRFLTVPAHVRLARSRRPPAMSLFNQDRAQSLISETTQ